MNTKTSTFNQVKNSGFEALLNSPSHEVRQEVEYDKVQNLDEILDKKVGEIVKDTSDRAMFVSDLVLNNEVELDVSDRKLRKMSFKDLFEKVEKKIPTQEGELESDVILEKDSDLQIVHKKEYFAEIGEEESESSEEKECLKQTG